MNNKRLHNIKKKKARKLMTQKEIKNNTPIFQSRAWLNK